MAKKGSGKQAAKQPTRVRKLDKKLARKKARFDAGKRPPLPGNFRLSRQAFDIIRTNWKVLGGIMLVYLILNIIFASGISSLSSTVDSIKADLSSTSASAHPLVNGSLAFLALLSSAGASSSATGSILQAALLILVSLTIIWALRQLLAGKPVRVKLAYYNATAPLVPFLLVIFVIFIQLLPVSFGSVVLTAIADSLGAIGSGWSVLFAIILALLAAWSIYMISASIFAVYISTLPNMQPRVALRSAKNLVHYRRWPVIRKVLFLPVGLLVIMAAIMIPLIIYATVAVVPVFYILGMLALLFAHTYLYNLYRNLLS